MKNSMEWIVWEMLEKLKADKKILSRVRDEARVLCETSDEDSKQYWKGLLRGYDRQIIWTQNNIDKLESMIEEEQRKCMLDWSELTDVFHTDCLRFMDMREISRSKR